MFEVKPQIPRKNRDKKGIICEITASFQTLNKLSE